MHDVLVASTVIELPAAVVAGAVVLAHVAPFAARLPLGVGSAAPGDAVGSRSQLGRAVANGSASVAHLAVPVDSVEGVPRSGTAHCSGTARVVVASVALSSLPAVGAAAPPAHFVDFAVPAGAASVDPPANCVAGARASPAGAVPDGSLPAGSVYDFPVGGEHDFPYAAAAAFVVAVDRVAALTVVLVVLAGAVPTDPPANVGAGVHANPAGAVVPVGPAEAVPDGPVPVGSAHDFPNAAVAVDFVAAVVVDRVPAHFVHFAVVAGAAPADSLAHGGAIDHASLAEVAVLVGPAEAVPDDLVRLSECRAHCFANALAVHASAGADSVVHFDPAVSVLDGPAHIPAGAARVAACVAPVVVCTSPLHSAVLAVSVGPVVLVHGYHFAALVLVGGAFPPAVGSRCCALYVLYAVASVSVHVLDPSAVSCC